MAKDIKDSEYVKSLSAERAKDPKSYDERKAKYDTAVKQDETDKDYSAWDTLKSTVKKAVGMKKGGCVKMAKGGNASKRADGIAQRGKTRGTIC